MPRCWRSRTSRPTLTTGENRPPGPSVLSGETQLHACERDASSRRSSKLSFSGHKMLLSVVPRETVPAARPAASLPPASLASRHGWCIRLRSQDPRGWRCRSFFFFFPQNPISGAVRVLCV